MHNDKVTAHVFTESALAAAKKIEAAVTVEAAANLEDDQADCAASLARQNAANVAQAKKDQAYLDDALDFVNDLRSRISGFQDKKAARGTAAAATAEPPATYTQADLDAENALGKTISDGFWSCESLLDWKKAKVCNDPEEKHYDWAQKCPVNCAKINGAVLAPASPCKPKLDAANKRIAELEAQLAATKSSAAIPAGTVATPAKV